MATSPLLQPSPNLATWGCHSPGGTSVRELLQDRNKNSPLPPPSPSLSESGFSTFVPSPATVHSPIFNFAAHHHFDDEPYTPEPSQEERFDDYNERHSPRLAISTNVDDLGPPRMASPPLPASPSNNTETFSDCSPSPSIASVRMAKVALIPHRRMVHPSHDASRLSAASSMLSGSIVENDQEDDDRFQDSEKEEWNEKGKDRSAFVEDLPRGVASLFGQTKGYSNGENSSRSDGAKTPVPLPSAQLRRLEVPPEPVIRTTPPLTIKKSESQQSELSSESWKEDLDAAVKHLESDPNLKPDADAMQRMKSILGPKMKIISKAPWDSEFGDDEPLASAISSSNNFLPTRRSTDILSRQASPPPTLPTSTPKSAKDRKENIKPSKSRARSFSVLTSRRNNTIDENKERDDALQGLGLGLGQVTSLPDSPSKRSFKGLVKSYSGLPSSDSFHDLSARTKSQLDFTSRNKQSSPPEISSPTVTIVSERQRVEAGQLRKPSRAAPPPVTFDLVASRQPSSDVPRSAPPTVSTFARSDSHASLLVRHAPSHTSSSTTLASSSSPSTPSAFVGAPPSPTSPDGMKGSYFTAVPGGAGHSPATPYSFGHHLISLEEARQRETDNRAASHRKITPPSTRLTGHDSSTSLSSKNRTRESTLESVGTRKTSTTPPATQFSSSSPANAAASLPTPRSLKPKKSGFLKRMMGGADRSERMEMPNTVPSVEPVRFSEEPRPIITSSASIPSLVSISAPSSLSKATALKTPHLASPNPAASPSLHSSRVNFGATPTPDPNQRLRKGFAPSLSLRPVSMAFSAGLPSDFLANLAAAETANANLKTSPNAPEALVSPNAPSFKSSASTAPTSVFDEAVLSPSALPLTPLTPTFPLSPAVSPGFQDELSSKYASLQDEYVKAQKTWKAIQWELESQIRSLQIELEMTKEEKLQVEASIDDSDCEKCVSCGTSKGIASTTSSIIQRPRFKGQAGTGTLFGSSASGANA